jgi:hypothetical protein
MVEGAGRLSCGSAPIRLKDKDNGEEGHWTLFIARPDVSNKQPQTLRIITYHSIVQVRWIPCHAHDREQYVAIATGQEEDTEAELEVMLTDDPTRAASFEVLAFVDKNQLEHTQRPRLFISRHEGSSEDDEGLEGLFD